MPPEYLTVTKIGSEIKRQTDYTLNARIAHHMVMAFLGTTDVRFEGFSEGHFEPSAIFVVIKENGVAVTRKFKVRLFPPKGMTTLPVEEVAYYTQFQNTGKLPEVL